MPFASGRFDCTVATLLLRTADVEKSLREIRRVLKPGGLFLFVEHVRPKGETAGRLFDVLNTVWPALANGCNLNRGTDEALAQSGFSHVRMERKGGVFCYGSARNGEPLQEPLRNGAPGAVGAFGGRVRPGS